MGSQLPKALRAASRTVDRDRWRRLGVASRKLGRRGLSVGGRGQPPHSEVPIKELSRARSVKLVRATEHIDVKSVFRASRPVNAAEVFVRL